MKINKKLHVLIEAKMQSDKGLIEKMIKKSEITFDNITFLDKIPRDLRHNSKIDYGKLNELIKK